MRPPERQGSRPEQRRSAVGSGTRDAHDQPLWAPAWFGPTLDRPSLLLRARVYARRRSLDGELANGADPLRSAALALRARQLVARPTRESFAFGLEALVLEAARAPLPRGMAIPLPRRQITQARRELLGLAACLRAERPVYARGMALLSWLLSDGAGPAFNSHARSSLRHVARSAAQALDGRWPDASRESR